MCSANIALKYISFMSSINQLEYAEAALYCKLLTVSGSAHYCPTAGVKASSSRGVERERAS